MIISEDVIKILRKRVSPIGNGAHVLCPKEHAAKPSICPSSLIYRKGFMKSKRSLSLGKSESSDCEILKRHENLHTNAGRLGSSRTRRKKISRRIPGRRKGYKGVTRPRPEPQKTIVLLVRHSPEENLGYNVVVQMTTSKFEENSTRENNLLCSSTDPNYQPLPPTT